MEHFKAKAKLYAKIIKQLKDEILAYQQELDQKSEDIRNRSLKWLEDQSKMDELLKLNDMIKAEYGKLKEEVNQGHMREAR